jgi:hypothetical protein
LDVKPSTFALSKEEEEKEETINDCKAFNKTLSRGTKTKKHKR